MGPDGANTAPSLRDAIARFRDVRVLVVGDVMLDRYWRGRTSRISPEAPVLVLSHQETARAPGGAANVAANVASLGGRATLVGAVGVDEPGRELGEVVRAAGVHAELLAVMDRMTTVKTRIFAHAQQLVRIDEESTEPLSDQDAEQFVQRCRACLSDADVLVVSDYAKGVLTPQVLAELLTTAREAGVLALVDPKARDYHRYGGATLIAPNHYEAAVAAGLPAEEPIEVARAGTTLLSQIDVGSVLVTQGPDGMTLFERDREPVHVPVVARQVYDVTGAGDTVMAALALALGAGASTADAARLANQAAALAVEQSGTSTVRMDALRRAVLARETEPETIEPGTTRPSHP